jgi:hypothetical protein
MNMNTIMKLAAGAALVISAQGAWADTATFNFTKIVSGGTPTPLLSSYGSLSFEDVAGGVKMTFSLANLGTDTNAYDKSLFFNFGPNGFPSGSPSQSSENAARTGLTFTHFGNDNSGTLSRSSNNQVSAGGGKYDLSFSYTQGAFNSNETSTYVITGNGFNNSSPVKAADFEYLSMSKDNSGTYYASMYLKDAGSNNREITVASTSFTHVAAVPEPETYAMMLAGLGLLGFVARRRIAKQAA